MAQKHETEAHKRKRDIADDSGIPPTRAVERAPRTPQPPPPHSDSPVPINYLSRAQNIKLKLIQGESDTFSDVLSLIGEYEGVLSRNESLAANLGAKLVGPRLSKAMEKVFEGSIVTSPPQAMFTPDPITWVDVVEFAKANPADFGLTTTPNGRVCQFLLKGVQAEIGEDDWRLIVSGALDRTGLMVPQPLEDDEAAEFATVEILEHRLQILVKKADEVAGRARVLNNVLRGRKASIHSRRTNPSTTGGSGAFQAVNQARGTAAAPVFDVYTDLLQQFQAPATQPAVQRLSSASSVPATPGTIATASSTPRTSVQQPVVTTARPSPGCTSEPQLREMEDGNRSLMAARVEKLEKMDVIHPPCDRCRRLKVECTKNLTACSGCTKKHARCVWKSLTEDEVNWLKGETSYERSDDGDDDTRDGGKYWASASQAETGDRPTSAEVREDLGSINRPVSRIAVGRQPDDMWIKGTRLPSLSKSESMDVDSHESREMHGTGPQQSEHRRLSHMASAATAAADAVAASRRGVPGQPL